MVKTKGIENRVPCLAEALTTGPLVRERYDLVISLAAQMLATNFLPLSRRVATTPNTLYSNYR